MGVTMSQVIVPVSGSGSVPVCTISPGQQAQLMIQTSGGTVYIGMSQGVTSANGVPFSVNNDNLVMRIPHRSSSQVSLWALNASALTAVELGFVLTTPS